MFLFYVLSFFKKGDIIQEGTLIKEILNDIPETLGSYHFEINLLLLANIFNFGCKMLFLLV